MGNRSFLYLGTQDQIAQGEGRPFADANNNFPTLWHLLLADGAPTAANQYQRVFGDAGTLNISSSADAAMARVRALADGIVQHPLYASQPRLSQQFDALQAYFHQEAEALGAPDGAGLLFSANLDELSWLDGDDPDTFVAKARATCDATADAVRAALESERFPALDRALELDAYGSSFAEWNTWAWTFGFGGLDHPYFNARDEPRDEPFDAYVEPEPEDVDSWLGEGLERFTENGRTGVTRSHTPFSERARVTETTVLIPAEWDRIDSAGHGKAPLFWVYRDKRIGLLRADRNGATLLHPCELDDAWRFEQVERQWIATAQVGDAMGLMNDDGTWIARPDAITPPMTEAWDFVGRYAAARSGETVGVMTARGQWSVAPVYDAVDDLRPTGVGIARRGSTRQLIMLENGVALSESFDRLSWLGWPGVFEGEQVGRGGTMGWWHQDGRPMIAPAWDSIALLTEQPWRIAVVRDGRVGLRDPDDRELVAPLYSSIISRADAALQLPPRHVNEAFAERNDRSGLIDDSGAVLIPFQYDSVENFEAVESDGGATTTPGRHLRVATGKGAKRREGAWDLGAQREVVACEWQHLYAILLFRDGETRTHGYLAVRYAPGHKRGNELPLQIGLLRGDGTLLHEARYAWIGERYDATSWMDAALMARSICTAWSRNEPVQAALATEDRYEWLSRDGGNGNDIDVRESQFQSGDFEAGHAIACQYRDGDGVPQDAAMAQRWFLLAAGQPASVFDVPKPGLFKRLLGARPSSPLMPASPDPRGSVQAICDLCQLLIANPDDTDGLVAARAWLELVNGAPGRANAEAQMLLGFMMLEGVGGPQDEAGAFPHTSRAASRGNVGASFNLGLMHEFGRGIPVNAVEAKKHFGVASRGGDTSADLALGRMMIAEAAEDGDAKVAAKTLKQAVYHLQQAMDSESEATIAAASAFLGPLYWAGRGVKRDQERAVTLLTSAAERGETSAMQFLADEVYGNPESRYAAPDRAEEWRRRLES